MRLGAGGPHGGEGGMCPPSMVRRAKRSRGGTVAAKTKKARPHAARAEWDQSASLYGARAGSDKSAGQNIRWSNRGIAGRLSGRLRVPAGPINFRALALMPVEESRKNGARTKKPGTSGPLASRTHRKRGNGFSANRRAASEIIAKKTRRTGRSKEGGEGIK